MFWVNQRRELLRIPKMPFCLLSATEGKKRMIFPSESLNWELTKLRSNKEHGVNQYRSSIETVMANLIHISSQSIPLTSISFQALWWPKVELYQIVAVVTWVGITLDLPQTYLAFTMAGSQQNSQIALWKFVIKVDHCDWNGIVCQRWWWNQWEYLMPAKTFTEQIASDMMRVNDHKSIVERNDLMNWIRWRQMRLLDCKIWLEQKLK